MGGLSKSQILDEVKQWSKEHGGISPSEKIIKEELGIPKWDWNQYWTRVTDIHREAGLNPNIFDKTKYTKADLCDRFIEAIRLNQNFPTRSELDLLQKNNPKLPASGTYYKKLGLVKSGELQQSILEYIKGKKGYDDVFAICQESIRQNQQETPPNNTPNRDVTHGWVYLFRHGHYNHYRIGKTTDLLRRGYEIRIQLPERAILIHTIETADITGVETYWLNRFKSRNLNGDWFELSKADLSEFIRWKRIY